MPYYLEQFNRKKTIFKDTDVFELNIYLLFL
jgi:hypothetical protein